MKIELAKKQVDTIRIVSSNGKNVPQHPSGSSRWSTDAVNERLAVHRHFHTYLSGFVTQYITLEYVGEFPENDAALAVAFLGLNKLRESKLFSEQCLADLPPWVLP